jgi:hypothetical protein
MNEPSRGISEESPKKPPTERSGSKVGARERPRCRLKRCQRPTETIGRPSGSLQFPNASRVPRLLTRGSVRSLSDLAQTCKATARPEQPTDYLASKLSCSYAVSFDQYNRRASDARLQ